MTTDAGAMEKIAQIRKRIEVEQRHDGNRYRAIAITKIEEAEMWLAKSAATQTETEDDVVGSDSFLG